MINARIICRLQVHGGSSIADACAGHFDDHGGHPAGPASTDPGTSGAGGDAAATAAAAGTTAADGFGPTSQPAKEPTAGEQPPAAADDDIDTKTLLVWVACIEAALVIVLVMTVAVLCRKLSTLSTVAARANGACHTHVYTQCAQYRYTSKYTARYRRRDILKVYIPVDAMHATQSIGPLGGIWGSPLP